MADTVSYLHGAHNLNVQNLSIAHSAGHGKSAMEYLQEHIAIGAIHNSEERCDAPTCYPETRVAVQRDIVSWITHGDDDAQPMQLMWLSGPAGSGKTAIAGSVAEMCQEMDILAGSFFFSSYSPSPERCSKRYLVPTLVYQLLQHDGLEGMEQYVLRAIQRDPAIFKKRLKDQFEALILKPLRRLRSQQAIDPRELPKIVIIDGVDEVKAEQPIADPSQRTTPRLNEDDHHEIISCLLHATKDTAFSFRILVVSRPERVFTDFFSTHAQNLSKQIFLDENYDPDSDIRLYLTSTFAELGRRYRLSSSWPAEEVITELVENASGQFIYPATVVRFVSDGTNPPPAQLDRLLKIVPRDVDTDPFSALHALYTYIMMSSPNPRRSAHWILAVAFATRLSAWASRLLIESEQGEAEHLLRPLASLVDIPAAPADRTAPYRVHHKSLLDFLLDAEYCPDIIYVDNIYQDHFPEWKMFFYESWLSLLIKKGPRIPLPTSETEEFLDSIFCEIPEQFGNYAEVAARYVSEEERQLCDWYWWACKVVSSVSEPDSQQTALSVAILRIHRKCPLEECTARCKIWVADITRACTEYGWSTPGEGWLQSYEVLESGEKSMLYDSFSSICNALEPPATPSSGGQESSTVCPMLSIPNV